MEFNKSKVYTSINADELKAGSKCIFAETLKQLKEKIHSSESIEELSFIADENKYRRFIAKDGYEWYFAYLISEPKEETYRPYIDGDEAFLYLHDKWLINKDNKAKRRVTDVYSNFIRLGGDDFYFNDLFQHFEIYSITGKNEPCGVKINGCN